MSFIGIDLGAQTTVCTILLPGIPVPELVSNDHSHQSTPTVVSFRGKARLAGETAMDEIVRNGRNSISNVKRLLGADVSASSDPALGFDDVHASKLDFVEADGKLAVAVDYNGSDVRLLPEQICAVLLKRIAGYAHRVAVDGDVVGHAISIPSSFNDAQRVAILAAAQIAGLTNVSLVHDGTAAAFAYVATHDLAEPTLVAFVDVGHAYVNITLARVGKDLVKVAGEASDCIGSASVDAGLVKHFGEAMIRKGVDLDHNVRARLKTSRQVEKLKRMLSSVTEGEITVDSVSDGSDFYSKCTRAELEAQAQTLLTRISDTVDRAFKAAGVGGDAVSAVEVLGNGSRMPCVKERLQQIFGKDLSFTMDGASAVASGAALFAKNVSTRSADAGAPGCEPPLPVVDADLVARLSTVEEQMSGLDKEVVLAGERKNDLESMIFRLLEQLSGPLKSRISEEEASKARAACAAAEGWLWDTPQDADSQTFSDLIDKLNAELPDNVLVQRDALLAEEAAKRAEEDAAAAKLRDEELALKKDRVAANARMKEKGNSLFKQGQFEEAAEAYIKALNGFLGVELDRKETTEAEQVKLSCYLNLAACHAKLNRHQEVVHCATKALDIDSANAKALFRRANGYIDLRKFAEAAADLNRADQIQVGQPDVVRTRQRLEKAIELDKQREKKLYASMFK